MSNGSQRNSASALALQFSRKELIQEESFGKSSFLASMSDDFARGSSIATLRRPGPSD